MALTGKDLRMKAKQVGFLKKQFLEFDLVQERLKRLLLYFDIVIGGESSSLALVIGKSGAGKTLLLEKFRALLLKERNLCEDQIIMVEVPEGCTPKSLCSRILKALGDPNHNRGTAETMTTRIDNYFLQMDIRVVMFDEFQHFIDRDNKKVSYGAMDRLKGTFEHHKVALFAAGMPPLRELIGLNTQQDRRTLTRMQLDPLPYSSVADRQRFQAILLFYAKHLPFGNAEAIALPNVADQIYQASQGLLGLIVRLLTMTSLEALYCGRDQLESGDFWEAFEELRTEEPDGLGAAINPFGTP